MPTAYNDDVDLQIWSRGTDLERRELIEEWSEFHIDLKWSDMSTWSLTLPTDEFMKKYGVANLNNQTLAGAGGIKVFRNGEYYPLISGPITEAKRDWNGSKDEIILTGMDDKYWLTTRIIGPSWIAWPSYTWWYDNAGGTYGWDISQGYSGVSCEYLMKALLYWNVDWAGNNQGGSHSHCIPWFYSGTIGSPQCGSAVSYQARLETAFTVCKNVCLMNTGGAHLGDSDIQFNVVQPYDGYSTIGGINYKLFFTVDPIVDLTSRGIFGTDFGTVRSYTYDEKRPEANYTIAGGPDIDPTSHVSSSEVGFRYYSMQQNANSIATYGRIEEFLDVNVPPPAAGGAAYNFSDLNSIMSTKSLAELKLKAYNATAEIALMPDEMTQCGNYYEGDGDFYLGAKVTVKLNQQYITDVIRELKFDFTPDKGEIVTPTVCDAYQFYHTKPMPFTHDDRWGLADIRRNWK